MGESNVDKLEKAGLVKSEELDDDHKSALENLSSDEVESLIQIKQKLGASGDKGEEVAAKVL